MRIRAELVEGMILHLRFAGLNVVQKPLSKLNKGKKPQGKEEVKREEAALTLDMVLSQKDHLIRILKEITFSYFYFSLRFGLDDAADTGKIYGFIMALKGAAFAESRVTVNVNPVFGELVFEPDCTCEILIRRVFRIFIPLFGIYRTFSAQKSVKSIKRSTINDRDKPSCSR